MHTAILCIFKLITLIISIIPNNANRDSDPCSITQHHLKSDYGCLNKNHIISGSGARDQIHMKLFTIVEIAEKSKRIRCRLLINCAFMSIPNPIESTSVNITDLISLLSNKPIHGMVIILFRVGCKMVTVILEVQFGSQYNG
ncbi:hypothetical protein CDAR_286871 [Caerostris darwini]|uniref:Uncharacterized protein n=1 Tax=Caerostris darwini TaxID=1538125 RepID=A0AAV4RDA4_9ARAC|nr:hypothetical protein CDAR_286871 [Caerostris darwini]